MPQRRERIKKLPKLIIIKAGQAVSLVNFFKSNFVFKLKSKAVLYLSLNNSKFAQDLHFIIGRQARVNLIFNIKQSVGLKRYHLTADLSGRQGQLVVKIVHQGWGNSETRYFLDVNHYAAETFARVEVRRLLQANSSSIFYGMIKISKSATAADSYLSDKTLLLGHKVKSLTVPALEIKNNNVKASHGVTAQTLNEQELFYLRSRGLSRSQAIKLIATAFLRF